MLRGKPLRRAGRKFVGADDRGNKYYASPPPTVDGQIRMVAGTSHVKEIREVEFPWGDHPEDYVPGTVPMDWQCWLSGQRVEPPLETLAPTVGEAELPQVEQSPVMGRAGGQGEHQERAPAVHQAHAEPAKEFKPGSWQPGVAGVAKRERDAGGEGGPSSHG
jgi:hypothetical protein